MLRRLGVVSLLTIIMVGMSGRVFSASGFSDLSEMQNYSAEQESVIDAKSGSNTANAGDEVETGQENAEYVENNWLNDFEVHFFISLPFTAFFSYLSVMSVDAFVQGKFTPDFHQADVWMIAGFAIGSSVAIALGSVNRVPDQSIYQMRESVDEPRKDQPNLCGKIEVMRIDY